MFASNSRECCTEIIGRKITGALFNNLAGTKTFILDDGSGFTFASNGSFWRNSSSDVQLAIRQKIADLKFISDELREVLAVAGFTE